MRLTLFIIPSTLAGMRLLGWPSGRLPGLVSVAGPTSMTWLGLSIALRQVREDMSLLGARHAAHLRWAINGRDKSDVIDVDVLPTSGEVFTLKPLRSDFDDPNLVACAGLVPVIALAVRLPPRKTRTDCMSAPPAQYVSSCRVEDRYARPALPLPSACRRRLSLRSPGTFDVLGRPGPAVKFETTLVRHRSPTA